MNPIKLTYNNLNKNDINSLIEWLKTEPQLTKGEQTIKFEESFSKYIGCKYSVMVNSGSSANLAMLSVLKLSELKNNKVVVPSVSWSTTVSPVIQLGYDPILCDCELENLGVDINKLEYTFKKYNPSILLIVHALGFPCKMDEIKYLCDLYNVILLEDSCETLGSEYKNIKTGNFGLMSSFSLFWSHHISTIEGGIVCTDSIDMYNKLKMVRSHGWSRDVSSEYRNKLKIDNTINDFNELYTFYYPGYNIRSTDLQAYLGILQLEKINDIVKIRYENFKTYQYYFDNNFWKIDPDNKSNIISNFAYPIIHPWRKKIINILKENNIECRPLICGSMSKQPFYTQYYKNENVKNAELIHDYGLYIPNHLELTKENIKFICKLINSVICTYHEEY